MIEMGHDIPEKILEQLKVSKQDQLDMSAVLEKLYLRYFTPGFFFFFPMMMMMMINYAWSVWDWSPLVLNVPCILMR